MRLFRSFQASVAVTFGITIIIFSIIISVFIGQTVRQQVQQQVTEQMNTLAHGLAEQLDRGMFERYQDTTITAATLMITGDDLSIDEQRATLELLTESLPDYSWIGVTDSDGIVLASTQGILESVDVSQRPWFIEGRDSVYVGDVHAALLLEPYFTSTQEEPLRLVDISIPLTTRDGELRGVLGVHLNWDWARRLHNSLVSNNLEDEQTEVFIVSENHEILVGGNSDGQVVPQNIVDNLIQDDLTVAPIQWGAEARYLVSYSPTEGYRDYPGLGWYVVTRQPVEIAFAPVNTIVRMIWLIGAILGFTFISIGWGLAGWVTYPIKRIVNAAQSISEGNLITSIPRVDDNYEVETLSQSLQQMVNNLRTEIAERKEAQQKLSTQQEKLVSILDNIPVMIIEADKHQFVDYMNTETSKKLGWDLHMLEGDIDFISVISPDASMRDHVQNMLTSQNSNWETFLTYARDGEPVYTSWTSVHLSDGRIICIGIDLTAQKQLEDDVQASRTVRFMLETATQGVVLVDEENTIVMVNQYIEDTFGINRDELLGKSVDVLLPQANQETHKQLHQAYSENPVDRPMGTGQELLALHADGTTFPVEVSLTPIEIEGEMHIMAFVVNISERKQNEFRRNQQHQMELALEKEKLLQELQGRFVNLVSHEFRTPLSVINMSADVMLRYLGKLDEERLRAKLTTVQTQVESMIELMEQGLEKTKQRARHIELTPEWVDTKALIEQVVATIQSLNTTKHIFEIKAHDGKIYADPLLLDQLISNLLINATRYSPAESTISITAKHLETEWIIDIQDSGVGIPEADVDLIFEPFFRSDNVTMISGTGLGLSIVKRYVDAHEGTIDVMSVLDEGTRITLHLPLTQDDVISG